MLLEIVVKLFVRLLQTDKNYGIIHLINKGCAYANKN
jgi:hypothetical protein